MRKIAAAALIIGVSFNINVPTVDAKSAKEYKNCKELNKDYKGGVAKSSSIKNRVGRRSTNHLFLKNYMKQTKKVTVIRIILLAKNK